MHALETLGPLVYVKETAFIIPGLQVEANKHKVMVSSSFNKVIDKGKQ